MWQTSPAKGLQSTPAAGPAGPGGLFWEGLCVISGSGRRCWGSPTLMAEAKRTAFLEGCSAVSPAEQQIPVRREDPLHLQAGCSGGCQPALALSEAGQERASVERH